jgi:uncharacterized delta-60 repeat protein
MKTGRRRVIRSAPALFAFLLLFTMSPSVARSQPSRAGALDRTFSGNGKVSVRIGSPSDYARALAIQPDGNIILAGTANFGVSGENVGLVRFRPDGSKDGSFGHHGEVETDLGGQDEAYDVALQPDGRVVVTGWIGGDMIVIRYLPNGRLDVGFGDGGVVTIDIETYDLGNAIALDGNGRILVAGVTSHGTDGRPVLARLLPDGELDPNFGKDGLVIGGKRSHSAFEDVALQPDGRIVVSEVSYPHVNTRRYLTDGTPDPSFGSKGTAPTPLSPTMHVPLAIGPDGEIVVAATVPGDGDDHGDFGIAALRPDGSRDLSFGEDGLATVDFGGSTDEAMAVAVAPDGSVVAGGDTSGGGRLFAVARVLPNGTPDPSFGKDGTVKTGGGELGFVVDLALDAEGRIVAAGVASPLGDLRFMALRFLGA